MTTTEVILTAYGVDSVIKSTYNDTINNDNKGNIHGNYYCK